MSYLTSLALQRRPVTILAIILIFALGIFAYNSLQRELFPDIEFPNITVVTIYPSADPDTVVRDVTEPIEDAIAGMSGLREIQSTSSENISVILATFDFGEDLEEAERDIDNAVNGVDFPNGVEDPTVSRINTDTFPSIQLSVLGDRDIPSLQRLLDDVIVPRIDRVDGVFKVDTYGRVDEQVSVNVDTDKLQDLGLNMQHVAKAISSNNINFPAGNIDKGGTAFPIRTAHELGSLSDVGNLVIGFEAGADLSLPEGSSGERRTVRLSDVADVSLGTDEPRTISRTNGKPSLTLAILKDPDSNTVDVTEGVLAVVQDIESSGVLPSDVEILVLFNDGPEVKESLDNLLREGLLGFIFAVIVVFVFLLNLRPSILKGVTLSLRPTVIIAISIPLSVLTGILFMSLTDLSLNLMSLAGLAIAVGRVVDDSIVVLENMYRHIQRGDQSVQAAYDATKEVGAAIVSSTLTTVAVFLPLAFIQGIVGELFSPFAISVSLALLGSTLVALTAVPVLGALLLRRGDLSDDVDADSDVERDTLIQRLYTPALMWALRHKFATLAIAGVITVASLGLTRLIPITFFPVSTPEFLTIGVELPIGASVDRTFAEVLKVERVLQRYEDDGIVEAYQVTLGSAPGDFGPGAEGGAFEIAGFFVNLSDDVPDDIADSIRAQLPGTDEVSISVIASGGGPPSGALEVNIIGNNFNDVTRVSRDLQASFSEIEGVINLSSNVSAAKDEVVINVDPEDAAEFGLDAASVGRQVRQFIVGRPVSEIELEGTTMNIVLSGQLEDVNDIERLKDLELEGPFGSMELGSISEIRIEKAPVSISRFDNERSASITGEIVAEDTQAIGVLVQEKIDALDLPPGIVVKTGGIFEQIAEGFQDVFQAMAIGVVLVYLVMVASLGSLRNPFIIVLSLPLAIVGALGALAITDKTLSLSALMGFLLLIGVVVTNAIVLLTFVEQLRERGYGVYEALVEGGRVRLRPILMTAFTTTFALVPMAASNSSNGFIGAELATVVIGGLVSSTFLTLIVVPVMYTVMNVSIPAFFKWLVSRVRRSTTLSVHSPSPAAGGDD